MICSSDDAKSLLRKWQEEKSALSCVLWDSNFGSTPSIWYVHGKCWAENVSETLSLAFSDGAALRIQLSSVLRFEFHTPLDVKSLPVKDASKHGSWLSIYVTSTLRLLVGERISAQS
jgi:hypothetical protein